VRHFIFPKASLYDSDLFNSTARTALALPSIMTRIDEALLIKELNARMFDNVIREDLLRGALTPPGAEVEFNYERLELLGINVPTFSYSI
jgi:capsid protein